jgi:MATE family multidrug resistance protein
VLVGQALGAGQAARARHICWEAIRLGMSIALVLGLTFWLGAPYIAAFYTTDLQVQAIAIPLIVMVGLYHLGDALQAITVNALRGYKNSVVPMVIYTVTLWVPGLGGGIVLGLTNTFGPARGASGFWLAAIASIWLVGGLMAIYLNYTAKKHCARWHYRTNSSRVASRNFITGI